MDKPTCTSVLDPGITVTCIEIQKNEPDFDLCRACLLATLSARDEEIAQVRADLDHMTKEAGSDSCADYAKRAEAAERDAERLRGELSNAEGVLRRIANGCADTHTPQQHAAEYFKPLSERAK